MVEPILAAQDTWFSQGGTTVKRTSITQIEIKDTYTPTGTVTSSWDASAAKDGSVMAYVEGTKLTISGNGSGKVYANPNSSYAFSAKSGSDRFTAMTAVNGSALLDTSKATTMEGMFARAVKLTTVDVSNWDTSNVTKMTGMFAGNSSVGDMAINNLDVSNWDTSKVTSMQAMFQRCSNLTSLDISEWDTGKCENMKQMFYGCTNLTSLDVANWNTENVTNMEYMFASFNQNAGDMKLANLNVSNWNTASATTMSCMFYGCGQITEMDLSKWNVSKVTNMSHMFADCFKMTSYNFTGWNTASLTTVDGMFNDNRALVSIDVSDFDTGKITDFDQLFEACSKLQTIVGLDKWDTSKGAAFQQVFSGCSSLTELNLSSWNVSSGKGFSQMFANCSNLKTIYVSNKWNVNTDILLSGTNDSGIGYNAQVFSGCTKLVGGAGTAHDASHTDYVYARIDGKDGNPGYLTDIDDPTQMLIQTGTLHKLGISVRGVTGDTSKYSPSDMNAALKDVRSEVATQADLITQIANALEGKAAAGDNNSVKITFNTARAGLRYLDENGIAQSISSFPITVTAKNGIVTLANGTLSVDSGEYYILPMTTSTARYLVFCFISDSIVS